MINIVLIDGILKNKNNLEQGRGTGRRIRNSRSPLATSVSQASLGCRRL